MTANNSWERTGQLPLLDALAPHLPPALLEEAVEFVEHLVAGRRTLQQAAEQYRHQRDVLDIAIQGVFRFAFEPDRKRFLQQSLELAARLAGADVAAVFLAPPEKGDTSPLFLTRHCTEHDEGFIRQELFHDQGWLHQVRTRGTTTLFPGEDPPPPRVAQELARRHARAAVAIPFLPQPDRPARGLLYLEHMSRPGAFDDITLVQACVGFIEAGTAAAERSERLATSADYTATHRVSHPYTTLVGRSRALAQVLARLELLRISRVRAPVLLIGEPGTGKETVAHILHTNHQADPAPFVSISCADSDAAHQARRLFGSRHPTRDPSGDSAGAIDRARGGTLYVQDIHLLQPEVQTRLERALATRVYTPDDSEIPRPFDTYLVCSSPVPLMSLAIRGAFDQALAERLSLFQVNLPPLRERREDILLLAEHFLARVRRHGAALPRFFSARALQELERRSWSGNIDELRAVVEEAAGSCSGRVVDLPGASGESAPVPGRTAPVGDWKTELNAFQSRLIRRAMVQADGNVARAAELLNISRQHLNNRLRALGLESLRRGGR